MRAPLGWLLFPAGLLLVALLVAQLPAETYRATQSFLLVLSAGILLLVAASTWSGPARRLQARVFALPLREDQPRFGPPREDELRATFRPLVSAGACLTVSALSALLR